MGEIRNNETGFSAIEVVLVLVIVALIGGVGYFVYKNHHKATTTSVVTTANTKPTTNTTSTKTTTTTQPSVNLTTIKASDGFSFSYPTDWSVTAYGKDESVNGGQVQPTDSTAIQWLMTKSFDNPSSKTDAMCVDLRVSTIANAGSYLPNLSKTATTKNGLEIWSNDTPANILKSPNAPDLTYIKLANGMALNTEADSGCGLQKSTTTNLTADQQLADPSYKAGLDILQSVKLN
jgi:hypothetical protein